MKENIIQTPIVEETEQSFLDYSLSVITDRAIPSAEDGFKPVVRRILYDMADNGYTSNKQYVKCASPVGDTMGRFHPHGDSSIYGALVGIAQPWTMRYPLIDFHGNCGSRDGDGPAAYRYTECRLAPIAEATLEDIKKNTVDWQTTYAETEKEPVYLPGRFPNLLCNGTTGIAVAMACSFAPHNLNEVIDAAIFYMNNRDATATDLCDYVKGPDFPTGGVVINKNELKTAYTTGKGKARIRGEYVVEKGKTHDTLVFTSIPYKVSKETLAEEIDKLCETKEIEGIAEIRDESNKKGVRFVIEIQKEYNAEVVANKLYKLTDLETTYSFNQVALVNKTPKLMTLKDLIQEYVKHQEDVFNRRCKFELEKLNARIHILQGLVKASENIDKIIQVIKRSEDTARARNNLMDVYLFTEAQAQAILDMKLSKLAHIEKVALERELEDKQSAAEKLLIILNDPAIAQKTLCEELLNFKLRFGDARRTKIEQINITPEEKEVIEIQPEDCVVLVTETGNIKRMTTSAFKAQKRNGQGVKTQNDITHSIISTNTIDALMVFTNYGRVYKVSVNDIPAGNNVFKGVPINTLVSMDAKEKFIAIASIERGTKEGQYVWFATKNGLIKKTALSEYAGIKRKTGITATNIKDGDELVSVFVAPDCQLMFFTENGMSLRINGKDIGATARTSIGVKGIALKDNDKTAVVIPCFDETEIILAFDNGTIKRVPIKEFTIQNRAGKGLVCAKNCKIIDAVAVDATDKIFIAGTISNICLAVSEITLGSRASTGIKAIKNGDIIAITKV